MNNHIKKERPSKQRKTQNNFKIPNSNDSHRSSNEKEKEKEAFSDQKETDEEVEYGTFDFTSGKPLPTYLTKKRKINHSMKC